MTRGYKKSSERAKALQIKKEQFLKTLEITGSVTSAAASVGDSRWTHKYWRKNDPVFNGRMEDILSKYQKSKFIDFSEKENETANEDVEVNFDCPVFNGEQQDKELFLRVYVKNYGILAETLKEVEQSKRDLNRWLKEDATFKEFYEELASNDYIVDLAEKQLVEKIKAGDVKAILFALKSKGAERGWYERVDPGATGTETRPVIIQQFDSGFFTQNVVDEIKPEKLERKEELKALDVEYAEQEPLTDVDWENGGGENI